MKKYFGTDGFRGEANVDLTALDAFRVGMFLGAHYSTEDHTAQIVIGKDTRRSSYMLENALTAGITSVGGDVYLMHVTTTPSVAYVARTENFDCGIIISASHNIFYDNGIKIINGDGSKLGQDVTNRLEAYINGEIADISFAQRDKIGKAQDHSSGRNRYIGSLISIPRRSFKHFKVGLDCANGAASSIAKNVFDALGAETYVINDMPDGININDNCGSTHIEQLQKLVKEKGLDIGFAYDGDADRCLCVDEKGGAVDGDAILYLCGRYLKETGRLDTNTIVTTIMSNIGLYKALDSLGISYEKTQVGDKYVFEAMNRGGHCLGGEQSGHIIFSKYASTGDGILTSLQVMEVMIEKKAALSYLLRELTLYPQILENVDVSDKERIMQNAKLKAAVKHAESELGEEGRILVRASGTESKIRVMAEAQTEEACRKYVEEITAVVKELSE